MILAIVGSRYFRDEALFKTQLNFILRKWGRPKQVFTGGYHGADGIGQRWASSQCILLTVFPPDWHRYGKAAGHIRTENLCITPRMY